MISACKPEPMMFSAGIEPEENSGRISRYPFNTRRSLNDRVSQIEAVVKALTLVYGSTCDRESIKHLERLHKLTRTP